MTFRDRERRGARRQNFLAYLRNTLERYDLMTEFGVVTQVKEKHISRGQPRPHPKGRGPGFPTILGPPTCARTV